MSAKNPVLSAALPKQQLDFCGPLFLSSTNFILPMKLLIGFSLLNLVGNVKMHQHLFEMVSCEHLCIPFDENKMAGCGRAFFGLLLVTSLGQWGVEKWDLTFDYQNIFANFQPNPYSYLAGYGTHINKYIDTTSSISIRYESLVLSVYPILCLPRRIFKTTGLIGIKFAMNTWGGCGIVNTQLN